MSMMKNLFEMEDLFKLSEGDVVSASERYKLFTGPKIGNTPQKGINWIGKLPDISLVIIRCDVFSGYGDRWIDEDSGVFLYYLMIEKRNTKSARINHSSSENLVLLNQHIHKAPILLMMDRDDKSGLLDVCGRFEVISKCQDNDIHPGIDSVLLRKISS